MLLVIENGGAGGVTPDSVIGTPDVFWTTAFWGGDWVPTLMVPKSSVGVMSSAIGRSRIQTLRPFGSAAPDSSLLAVESNATNRPFDDIDGLNSALADRGAVDAERHEVEHRPIEEAGRRASNHHFAYSRGRASCHVGHGVALRPSRGQRVCSGSRWRDEAQHRNRRRSRGGRRWRCRRRGRWKAGRIEGLSQGDL